MSRPNTFVFASSWPGARAAAALLGFVAGLALHSVAAAGIHVAPRTAPTAPTTGGAIAVAIPEASVAPDVIWALEDASAFASQAQHVPMSPEYSRLLMVDTTAEQEPVLDAVEFSTTPPLRLDSTPMVIPYTSAAWAGIVGMVLIALLLLNRGVLRRVFR